VTQHTVDKRHTKLWAGQQCSKKNTTAAIKNYQKTLRFFPNKPNCVCEGANNMELMSWSGFLASLAERWAAGCDWEHGQPPLGSSPQYTSIGQNLFATTGSRINLTSAIGNAWTRNE